MLGKVWKGLPKATQKVGGWPWDLPRQTGLCPESLLPEANSKHQETLGQVGGEKGKTEKLSCRRRKGNELLALDPEVEPVPTIKLTGSRTWWYIPLIPIRSL